MPTVEWVSGSPDSRGDRVLPYTRLLGADHLLQRDRTVRRDRHDDRHPGQSGGGRSAVDDVRLLSAGGGEWRLHLRLVRAPSALRHVSRSGRRALPVRRWSGGHDADPDPAAATAQPGPGRCHRSHDHYRVDSADRLGVPDEAGHPVHRPHDRRETGRDRLSDARSAAAGTAGAHAGGRRGPQRRVPVARRWDDQLPRGGLRLGADRPFRVPGRYLRQPPDGRWLPDGLRPVRGGRPAPRDPRPGRTGAGGRLAVLPLAAGTADHGDDDRAPAARRASVAEPRRGGRRHRDSVRLRGHVPAGGGSDGGPDPAGRTAGVGPGPASR
ncbi:hypothetical protein SAMN04489716_1137 [Actinoplanes derwentensis]|uniref:Uncharacterized protein n=1 Tax=Actinoplanes derwentensis TaxID=113562 RepID=A0A1H1TGW3_9ACTN|nr:hypothetical protein SAMN04489716_1137 [Actinoplanes derwentensis]